MDEKIKPLLANYLIAIGDDELILGHRDSEWCGHAPILEEDIAFANISLDEIGHARLWFELAASLLGEDPKTFPDQLAFYRDWDKFRSIQMAALPKGDWAFTMLRQFFFDSFENLRLEGLAESAYPPIAQAAAKIRNEEVYHLRHTAAWVPRLGLGTQESGRRMQIALEALWPFAFQLGVPLAGESELAAQGLVPAADALRHKWLEIMGNAMQEVGLAIPEIGVPAVVDRSVQSEDLRQLLLEMQEVPRQHPREVRW